MGRKIFLLIIFLFTAYSFGQVNININLDSIKRPIDSLSFGLNGSYAYMQSTTSNSSWRAGIKYAIGRPDNKTALFRLHRQGLVAYWSPNSIWNQDRILNGLRPLVNDSIIIMIDFDRAIGGNGMDIAPNDAAELVRIVNVVGKLGVKYWEIFNENGGDGATRGQQVKNCIRAMKQVDSTIKVGGPALSYFDQNFFRAFIQNSAPDIDFITYHGYGGGNTSGMSDAAIYDWAVNTGNSIRQMRNLISQYSPNKYIKIMLDEYNISWDWTIIDQRTTSNKGAVFSALVMTACVENGGDITNRWNDTEPAFAIMTNNGEPYTVAHVYHLFNRFCLGNLVFSQTSDSRTIVPFTVKTNQQTTIVLINRSSSNQNVNISIKGNINNPTFKRYQIWTRNGIDSSTINFSQSTSSVVVPDNSVTFLVNTTNVKAKNPILPALNNNTISAKYIKIYSISGKLIMNINLEKEKTFTKQELLDFIKKSAKDKNINKNCLLIIKDNESSIKFLTSLFH